MRIKLLLFLLLTTAALFAQDSSNVSTAFKAANNKPKYPLIKAKYPSYQLIAGFILVKEANEGDPFAQHELGLRYLIGRGFPKDTTEAVRWIERAVESNLPAAKFNYGIMQRNGIGVEWNPFAAYKNFKFAANAGMPDAQFIYGLILTDNLVVNQNLTEAYLWVKRSADSGFELAKEALKQFEKQGVKVEVDTIGGNVTYNYKSVNSSMFDSDESLMEEEWELEVLDFDEDQLADAEKIDKLLEEMNKNKDKLKKKLGIAEVNGEEEIEDTSAVGLIKYAAENGSPEALLIGGRSSERGLYGEKDIVKAAVNYLRSYRLGSNKSAQMLNKLIQDEEFFNKLTSEVDKGNPEAMYVSAGLIALGIDYRLTNEQALDLLRRSADKDYVFSFIELGLLYYTGTLVDKDIDEAYEYWERAADMGSREAKVRLAFAKLRDDEDMAENIEYLKDASEKGSVLAQAALGLCYEEGIGVDVNKGKAASYYRDAAYRGNQTAFISLKRMYDEARPEDSEFQIYE